MPQSSSEKMPSVYLYIPNIIGYFRIIINFVAFAVCNSNRLLFAILYYFSFVLDGVDGWFARKFNQGAREYNVTTESELHNAGAREYNVTTQNGLHNAATRTPKEASPIKVLR